ncbi:hypothetical protein [Butyrivibrio fibrisolvens]|uniref:hypothetical protein n=1 Tax=Butyrivibrio fibrisolvens TaxID=831 RepID=UPI0003B4DC75|nr:hypothetical protein [Butyrivibrio fibrisolvens]
MRSEDLLMSMNGIDDEIVLDTYNYSKQGKIIRLDKFGKGAAAAACLCLALIVSGTAYAALKYLKPSEVASKIGDETLKDSFENDSVDNNSLEKDAQDILKSQILGDYEIALLGIASGENISENMTWANENKEIPDKTAMTIAISRIDGQNMPDTIDDEFWDNEFFVNIRFEGLDEDIYNLSSLGGTMTTFVSDGIMYDVLEIPDIEGIGIRTYLDVYNTNDSSAIATFEIDTKAADNNRVNAVKKLMDDHTYNFSTQILSEEDRQQKVMENITPENINEYATPIEESRKIIKPDSQNRVNWTEMMYAAQMLGFSWDDAGDVDDDSWYQDWDEFIKQYFPTGQTGMSEEIRLAYGDTLAQSYIETYTLNEDGSVTYLVYGFE